MPNPPSAHPNPFPSLARESTTGRHGCVRAQPSILITNPEGRSREVLSEKLIEEGRLSRGKGRYSFLAKIRALFRPVADFVERHASEKNGWAVVLVALVVLIVVVGILGGMAGGGLR